MKKHANPSASDTQSQDTVEAIEGKGKKTLSGDWQQFARFWQTRIEKPLKAQRATAAKLAITAGKIEAKAKKQSRGKKATGDFAAVLSEPEPGDSKAIIEKAVRRLSENGKQQGRILAFPGRRFQLITGGGILAAAAAILIVFLMRPQLQYSPASPERVQAILQFLPEQEEAMGLLEERDSDEVAAFTYGFYIELAKNIDNEKQSKELAQVLRRLAKSLERRGNTEEATEAERLSLAAQDRVMKGIDLLESLNKMQSMLKKKWSIETDDWYWFGVAVANQLKRGFGMGNWDDIEDRGLDKVRQQLQAAKAKNAKMEKLRSDLREVFTARKCDISSDYCREKKEKLQDVLKETGIYRF